MGPELPNQNLVPATANHYREVNNQLTQSFPGFIPVRPQIILASNSSIRRQLLTSANVPFICCSSSFDEEAAKKDLLARSTTAENLSLALAEGKALTVSQSNHGLVLGCDQVLTVDDSFIFKPNDLEQAEQQLKNLRSRPHQLISSVVVCQDAKKIWSCTDVATLTMHDFSDLFLKSYLQRNWDDIRHCAGSYMVEKEGVRLFSKIEGDYFTVLGMPLIPVLAFLRDFGAIEA